MDKKDKLANDISKSIMIQEQKIISSKIEDPKDSPLSRYNKSYKHQLDQSPNRFKISRG